MSVDRCTYVKNIIAAQFSGAHEGITGDAPGADGVYTVTARAPSMARAREISHRVGSALAEGGHEGVELRTEPREDDSVTLVIRVNVGGIRGGL